MVFWFNRILFRNVEITNQQPHNVDPMVCVQNFELFQGGNFLIHLNLEIRTRRNPFWWPINPSTLPWKHIRIPDPWCTQCHTLCVSAICKKSCGVNGHCVDYNRCECYRGWRGRHCNKSKLLEESLAFQAADLEFTVYCTVWNEMRIKLKVTCLANRQANMHYTMVLSYIWLHYNVRKAKP